MSACRLLSELQCVILEFDNRISAHELKIERDWYKKPYVERFQRICGKCSSNQTEDELHLIINCPLYIDNREIMFNIIIIFYCQINIHTCLWPEKKTTKKQKKIK